MDDGEVKVILVVCPHQALKKTPVCKKRLSFRLVCWIDVQEGTLYEKKGNRVIEGVDTLYTFFSLQSQ